MGWLASPPAHAVPAIEKHTMKRPIAPSEASPQQRVAARRTALAMGLIALAVYVTFVLSGVIGR